MTGDTRSRLLAATLACVERWGLAKTTIEDVAAEAGLSRATVYRYFPGGREQLISETITWEVAGFFARVAQEVAAEPTVAGQIRRGLMFGHRAIVEHKLLQQVLAAEPEDLLTELSTSSPLVHGVIRGYLDDLLSGETLVPGVDRHEAADYLARLYLSYLGTPGRWDLADEASVDRLVRTQFLGGVLAGAGGTGEPGTPQPEVP